MRIYLDNCCYNRPFDDQRQVSVQIETEAKKEIQRQMRAGVVGDVNAERFVTLVNREPFDYTEWRRDNLFVGETVDSLMDKAEAMYVDAKI